MRKGYSLIEVMIVIALIGSLLFIAMPKYKRFIAKARRTEAQINLHNLYMVEQSFWAEHGKYTSNLRELGWRPEGKINYSYGFNGAENENNIKGALASTQFPAQCSADNDKFLACAIADIDGDGEYDIITINQNNEVSFLSDDLK